MKSASQYREALGLTQEEAALLLKIPKSMLGMFEIGQRDLPAAVKLQLITLSNSIQELQKEPDSSSKKEKKDEALRYYQKEIIENQYRLRVLERKLEQAKAKYQKYYKQKLLVTILENQEKEKQLSSKDMINVLKKRAEKNLEKYSLLEQIKIELRIKGHQLFLKELEDFVKNKS